MDEHEHSITRHRRVTRSASSRDKEFSIFYRSFIRTLVGFLVTQGARSVEAVEIAQDTMREIYTRWEDVEKPEAYARTTASRAWARSVASIEEDPVDVVPEKTPLMRYQAATEEWEENQDALRLLKGLPSRQRQVLAWTLNGYRPTEIAEQLDMKPSAVRASLNKARRAIAIHMAEMDGPR
jgi:RNA polymerase sigma factor (sigma-70 family)